MRPQNQLVVEVSDDSEDEVDRRSVSAVTTASTRCQQTAAVVSVNLSDHDEDDEDLTQPLLMAAKTNIRMESGATPATINLSENEYQRQDQHCHSASETLDAARNLNNATVKRKLFLATLFCLVFAVGEGIGGYISGSYAIVSDAAHMLSDFANLVIGLIAVSVSTIRPKKNFNFGLIRAEALGALFSVILIWNVAGILVFESTSRIIHRDFEIKSTAMIIAGGCAVAFNVFMVFFLRGLPHSHSHGGHSRFHNEEDDESNPDASNNSNTSSTRNHLNIRAATVHALGDVFQSTGVFIVSIIIKFRPDWKVLDPVCSIVFCFIVLYTTVFVLWDTIKILMEGRPQGVKFEDVEADLSAIGRVIKVHDLRMWALSHEKNALAVHLAADLNGLQAEAVDDIVQQATTLARKKYDVSMITVQVENYNPRVMNSCEKCQSI